MLDLLLKDRRLKSFHSHMLSVPECTPSSFLTETHMYALIWGGSRGKDMCGRQVKKGEGRLCVLMYLFIKIFIFHSISKRSKDVLQKIKQFETVNKLKLF